MFSLRLKIPPPLVALGAAALMWLLSRAAPAFAFHLPAARYLAACIALIGVATAITAVTSFRIARTTINPMQPDKASSLVASGIFKMTRNPMYLSLLMVLVAWAIYLSKALPIIILPAFIVYLTQFQIKPEEAALTSVFGQQFLNYKSRVRRWL